MGWLGEGWTKGTVTAALCLLAAAAGCDRAPKVDPNAGAECLAVRTLGEKSRKRWVDQMTNAPADDATLTAAADHSAALAKAAREIGAEFTKAAPKRADLAEAAEGARMLGDLAGQKMEKLAGTIRTLEAGLAQLTKLQGAANEAVVGMGKDIAAGVGCGAGGPPACADVEARVRELDERVRRTAGFADGAKAARRRADTLEGLAKAVEALPAAPPKQKAREDTAKRGREGAAAFRALAQALEAAAPAQERVTNERMEAEEAASRLAAELEAASKLCAAPGAAASGSAAPAASGKK